MEYWRYRAVTEDKSLFIQFAGDDGSALDPASFSGWGVKIVTRHGQVLHRAGTISSHTIENVVETTDTGIILLLPGALNPKQEVDVYAISIIELPHPELPGGKLVDISETPQFIYRCKRDYD
jgi:hypothetical protein